MGDAGDQTVYSTGKASRRICCRRLHEPV